MWSKKALIEKHARFWVLMSQGSTLQAARDAVGVNRRTGRHWRQATGGQVPRRKPETSGRFLSLEDRLQVSYQPGPGVHEELTDLVAAEQTCCSFVSWSVTNSDDSPSYWSQRQQKCPTPLRPSRPCSGPLKQLQRCPADRRTSGTAGRRCGPSAGVAQMIWPSHVRFFCGNAPGSGGRREFHPPAPTDPGVTVSCHRALVALVTRRS